MIPREIAAALLLAIMGIGFFLVGVLAPYLERRHRTEARRRELETLKARRAEATRRHPWSVVSPILFLGLLALLIVDGLIVRIGLPYSPYLSLFSPLDTYVQLTGVVLAAIGIVITVVAGKTLVLQVFAKASEERRLITTGIYAYIRHPLYLSDFLIPIGLFLIALNVVGFLLLPPFWFHTDSDLEVCGRKGKMTFLTKVIDCEETP